MQKRPFKEKTGEARLRDTVKKLGGLALKFFSSWLTGLPDRIVLMPGGRLWWVELKSEGKEPTPVQLSRHNMLRRLGFEVWVISTKEQLDSFLAEIQK